MQDPGKWLHQLTLRAQHAGSEELGPFFTMCIPFWTTGMIHGVQFPLRSSRGSGTQPRQERRPSLAYLHCKLTVEVNIGTRGKPWYATLVR